MKSVFTIILMVAVLTVGLFIPAADAQTRPCAPNCSIQAENIGNGRYYVGFTFNGLQSKHTVYQTEWAEIQIAYEDEYIEYVYIEIWDHMADYESFWEVMGEHGAAVGLWAHCECSCTHGDCAPAFDEEDVSLYPPWGMSRQPPAQVDPAKPKCKPAISPSASCEGGAVVASMTVSGFLRSIPGDPHPQVKNIICYFYTSEGLVDAVPCEEYTGGDVIFETTHPWSWAEVSFFAACSECVKSDEKLVFVFNMD